MKPITRPRKHTADTPAMPECWGHRGASAAFPENTIASFERAIRDGAEGIESDVHITKDNVIVMFHDSSLQRTTDGKGLIRDQNYHGVIEHVRTVKEPKQKIPTFRELCDLLMKEENKHVKLNIDIKPECEPDRLFTLMKEIVASYPTYKTDLSPRLILGLWHTIFLRAALEHVPDLARCHIGCSPWVARNFFWHDCTSFSMWFATLVTADGQAFIREANAAGKNVYVWTVNRRDEMIEATRWGVKAILTDDTAMLHSLRKEMASDFSKTRAESVGFFFRWTKWHYYTANQYIIQSNWISHIERRAGLSYREGAKRIPSLRAAINANGGGAQPPTNGGIISVDHASPELLAALPKSQQEQLVAEAPELPILISEKKPVGAGGAMVDPALVNVEPETRQAVQAQ